MVNSKMTYQQAEDYILSFTDYEKLPGIAYTSANYDLRRMDKLLQPLGNPHLGTKTVHIAGTKGKGSTAAMISQVLISAGYKVGLFTSPHLHSLRERIKINANMISESDFAALITEIKPIVEYINKQAAFGELTTFEILTAVVFTYFKRNTIDFQIIEVGLGGRLDATNVVRPDVCVITSISLDHTEILGDTVDKIAVEKAGIIKSGCVVISAPQVPAVAAVIEEACDRQDAVLIQVGKDVTWRETGSNMYRQTLTVNSKTKTYDLTIPLLGDYQVENAATAVAAIEELASSGANISIQNVSDGLSQVSWPGRLQILSCEPLVIVDGAHNAYSMRKLVENVKRCFNYQNCLVIFGTSCDKDVSGMAKELKNLSHRLVITSSSHPRAASVSSLAQTFNRLGIESLITGTVRESLAKTMASVKKNDLILVTGSLFVVGEAIAYFDEEKERTRTGSN
jgi:dihydrofolate synthase/folylpolyglutamate synthase